MTSRIRSLVVHCKQDKYDVYIGRASKTAPKGVACDWGNPFAMKNQSDDERSRVCEAYREWLVAQPVLVARAKRELKGKVLGCFCSPKDCHGHILAAIANLDSDNSENNLSKSGSSMVTNSSDEISEMTISGASDVSTLNCGLVDIGINIHNKQMLKTWRQQIERAHAANVKTVLLTGTSLACSANSLELAGRFHEERRADMDMSLYCTVGIHPHDAKTFEGAKTLQALRNLLDHPLAVAVGECGLDFNRNHSTPAQQVGCFEAQVQMACELEKPLFVHEREAHSELVRVLSKYTGRLPPVVIHCFTGSAAEARTYIAMGFYIGFTGTVCKFERGKELREMLPSIPLNRIMLETDTPFMGFVKGRRESEPMDVVGVAAKVAEVLGIDMETVTRVTTQNAKRFFSLPDVAPGVLDRLARQVAHREVPELTQEHPLTLNDEQPAPTASRHRRSKKKGGSACTITSDEAAK